MKTLRDPSGNLPEEPSRGGVVELPARRERTVAILTECFARNVLELEEFERRVALAHGAATVRELARLLEDIPVEVLAQMEEPKTRGLVLREEPQSLYGVLSTHRYRGPGWLKSRTVSAYPVLSTLALDFRELALPPGPVEINLQAVLSSVLITVPEELPVEVEVVPILAEVKTGRQVRSSNPGRGPSVRVTGVLVLSNVKVRVR
jgi:hypothetical protein